MSDTPRTDAAEYESQDEPITKLGSVDAEFARSLERHLNGANDLIVRLQAVTNDPHALWDNWLRGSVTLPEGIGDVRQYQDHIQRLEEELMDANNKHAALVADVALYEDRGERIKRLEKAGDALLNAHHPLTEGNWQKAKEAKP